MRHLLRGAYEGRCLGPFLGATRYYQMYREDSERVDVVYRTCEQCALWSAPISACANRGLRLCDIPTTSSSNRNRQRGGSLFDPGLRQI